MIETLFLFATFFEAREFLKKGNFTKQRHNFFISGKKAVFITGIGKKIEKHQEWLLSLKPQQVINVGLCGGVWNAELFDVVLPDWIGTEEELQKNNIENLSLLITLEKPMISKVAFLQQNPVIKNSQKTIVDMEGFYIKKIFDKQCNKTIIIKIVSDTGEEDFYKNFHERKSLLQKKIADCCFDATLQIC